MAETCMFCLDEIKSTEVAFNPIGCSCQFKSHGSCLQSWFEEKNQYECPICHTVAVPNADFVSVPNPLQRHIVQVVYVQNPRQEETNGRITRAQQRCIAICCVGWIFWSLFITLLDMFWNR